MAHQGQAPRRVAVGLSGGVDSTLAAALLLRQGCEVVGLTMQTWDGPPPAAGAPPRSGCYGAGSEKSLELARAMAARLGIRHQVIPLASEFRAEVLGYFRHEYLAGRTPNPCVVCNRRLKFGLLLEKARAAGIDFSFFATGHYARVEHPPAPARGRLLRGRDRAKDQSYFLAQLSQEQLRQALFPLGALEKGEVRALARELGFADAAAQRESQDFFRGTDYAELFGEDESAAGPIVDRAGRVLGRHRGLVRYTIGQRRGLGLGGAAAPLYVTAIDGRANALVVGPREDLFKDRLLATDLNWIAIDPPREPLRAQVRIRQQHREAEATLLPAGSAEAPAVEVRFDRPQMAIASGQAAVFYQDDLVLGGGIIAA